MFKFTSTLLLVLAQAANSKATANHRSIMNDEEMRLLDNVVTSTRMGETFAKSQKTPPKGASKGTGKPKPLIMEEILSMEYHAGDGMSLPAAYSEFGLPTDSDSMSFPSRFSDFGVLSKTHKSPPGYASMSLPLGDSNFGGSDMSVPLVQLAPKGSKTHKTQLPKGKEGSKPSSDSAIIKNASKGAESGAAAKKTEGKGGNGGDESKIQAPPVARSFTPTESTKSNTADELTDADFAAASNMESSASDTVSIGVLALAASLLVGGLSVV